MTVDLSGTARLERNGESALRILVMETSQEIEQEIARVAGDDSDKIVRVKGLFPELVMKHGLITKPDGKPTVFTDYLDELTAPGGTTLQEAYLSCANGSISFAWDCLTRNKAADAATAFTLATKYLDLAMGDIISPLDERARLRSRASKPRTDALQKLIIEIVTAKPDITQADLLHDLERCAALHDVINEIEDGEISFNDDGVLKSAPVSGLKDRLTRAKKIINSR
jgi:hypothetical protein